MFSVLINNYNYKDFIAEAIDSVIAQDEGDFELIIVDDGSTDDSLSVIDAYDDLRIQVIKKANGGQASAFNAGVAAAKGEWLCFLDSDDYWKPNKLSTLAKQIKSLDERVSLIAHGLTPIGTLDPESPTVISPPRFKRTSGIKWLKHLDSLPPFTPTSGLIIRRSAVASFFPLPEEEWKICADVPLIAVAALSGDFFYLQEHLSFYRIHGNNNYAGQQELEKELCRASHNNYYLAKLINTHLENSNANWRYRTFSLSLMVNGMSKSGVSKLNLIFLFCLIWFKLRKAIFDIRYIYFR